MFEYRITKYNPIFRVNGIYTRDDWTSVCDIGKEYNGCTLTADECVNVLSNYVNCIIETENADYVSNRNAGSRAMWSAKAEEEQAAKVKAGEVAKPVQYSVCLGMRSVGWLAMLICA